jgi:murein DD-endopeptidase MepM/ murein hydrolase activator NlpD
MHNSTNVSWPVLLQTDPATRAMERRIWPRLVRTAAGLCCVLGSAACVNLRTPIDAAETRMPPVIVTTPDGRAAPVRPERRPMLGSDSAFFRAYPLMVPVEGIEPTSLKDTFNQPRSGGRIHLATDILAMRGTPVLSSSDGRIIKLSTGGAGGITIYVADASGRYLHYYGHLEGYAPNVKEGLRVREGDVIGFVGTTGNAQPDAPHLHYQVMRSDKDYWNGTPIDVRPFMTKPGRMRQ